jgi:hypothetical protein
MNLQTKVHGHILRCVLLNNLVALALVVARYAEFLAVQQLRLQLVTITCMKMSRRL